MYRFLNFNFTFFVLLLISVNACFANDENLADNKVDEDKIRAVRQPPLKHKANAVDGKHFALLISVNEYNQINGLSPLRYCDNDMAGLENELKKFDFEVIRMHAKAEDSACHVNRTNVKEQLKRILDQATGENDVLLIAYSGHGVQEGNTRYLCPPNTPKNYDLGDLIPLYVDANNIADRSYGILNIVESRFGEKQFSGTCFLFIDACRNGNRTETKTLFPETGKFHIFSSCRPGEVSYEEERFQNGRFMHFVIQALNVDENENLVYEHLTSQVARQMSAFGKNQQRIQTPTRHDTAYEINGQLIFGQRKPDKFSMIPLMTGASLILRESKSPESQSHVVHKPVVSPTNPRNTQMLNATNQWPDFSTKDQEEQNVISDIVQLPGLNGEWWFQETPWYIPHARLALTYVLSDYSFGDQTYWRSGKDFLGKNIYAYLNTNTHDARELLWKYLNSDECKSIIPPDVMETIKELKKGIARSANSRELQYKKLKTFLENLQKNRKNVYNGIDLYTFAVFRHQMALLADNVTRSLDTENAKRSYRNAIAILKQDCESESQSTAILFYQLCLADYARFLAEVEGNASSHTETFKELVASFKSSYKHSLFQIAVYTDNAVNESNFGRLRESVRSFREAESKIAESKIAKTGHPLIASYHEQYGWNRIDYWRLIPAKESFETALLIREYNAWSSSSPIDMMYVTYGLHAMGTVSRFAGNNEKAKGYFKEAKEAIKKIRDNISEDSLSLTKNRLDEREASTLERLADLTLYYGAVSETEWIKALDDYARGATITNKTTTTKTRLLSKRALLLLRKEIPDQYRSEKNKFDEARDCLKEAHVAVEQSLENPSSNTTIPLIFFKAALIAIDLRESVALKDEVRFTKARGRMREFLEKFMFFSRDPDGQKRDTMELRMHCAAMLVESDVAMNKNDFVPADSIYLALCLYILSEKEGIHAYLRPYYEQQINLRIGQSSKNIRQEDIRLLALEIQRMRNISILNDGETLTGTNVLPQLSQAQAKAKAKGNEVSPPAPSEKNDEKIDEKETVIEDTSGRVAFNPTRNPLVDLVTLVIFYFPADGTKNGFVLVVPSDGRNMEKIPIELNRNALHIQSQKGELGNTLTNIWKRIETETERVSPFLSDTGVLMRQSVVISWSDESCWPQDSRQRITKEMFPFKDFPSNVTVQ